MEYLRNIGANNYQGGPPGGHNPPGCAREPRRALVGCAHPGPPPVPIFWYISHFDLEKIRRGLSGWRVAVLRRNLGMSELLPLELEHKAYWAIKELNYDFKLAGEKRLFDISSLDEWRTQAYENAKLFKKS